MWRDPLGKQALMPPPKVGFIWRKPLFVRFKQSHPIEFYKVLVVFDSLVESGRDMPFSIRAWCKDLSIHRPMVVLAQSDSVRWMVVVAFTPRHQMSCINDSHIADYQSKSASSTSIIVEAQYQIPEGSITRISRSLVIFRDIRYPLATRKRRYIVCRQGN